MVLKISFKEERLYVCNSVMKYEKNAWLGPPYSPNEKYSPIIFIKLLQNLPHFKISNHKFHQELNFEQSERGQIFNFI